MIKRILIPCLILFSLFLSNCKDKTDDTVIPPTPPTVIFPVMNSVDGVFAAIRTITINNTVETTTGTCYAAFYKNQNTAMKLDGGKVTLNTKECFQSENSIYFIVPTTDNPTGVTLSNQVLWQVTGNTTNGVPSVYNKDDSGLPAIPSIPEFVNMMSDFNYLLNWGSSSQCDSVIIIVKGPSATFKKTLNNTFKSYSIPKEEIVKLGVGKGSVQVINYKIFYATTGTKNYAFIKQSVGYTEKVTIQ